MIALHALNNAIAFGVTVEDASVSLVLGPADAARVRHGAASTAARPWHSERHMSTVASPDPAGRAALSPRRRTPRRPPRRPRRRRRPSPAAGRHRALDGGLATTARRATSRRRRRSWCAGVVKPYVRGRGAHALRDPRGKASKKVRRAVGRGGALRVPLQGRQRRPVRLVVKHRRSRRPGGVPHAQRDGQVVNWQAGAGLARAEGAAAPARPAEARLRHAGDRPLRRRSPRAP